MMRDIQTLRLILGAKDSSILIIEDEKDIQQDLQDIFKINFPLLNINILPGLTDGVFEKTITDNKFSVITVDGSLGTWLPHPRFGNKGKHLIPFIKKNRPGTYIFGLSSNSDTNKELLAAGADDSCNKMDLSYQLGS